LDNHAGTENNCQEENRRERKRQKRESKEEEQPDRERLGAKGKTAYFWTNGLN